MVPAPPDGPSGPLCRLGSANVGATPSFSAVRLRRCVRCCTSRSASSARIGSALWHYGDLQLADFEPRR
eukprot:4171830-Alexandrium_andersonii.AAC.1